MREAYPVNLLRTIRDVPEVVHLFAATANPLKVVVSDDKGGRGILGVIDGERPTAVETEKDVKERRKFLRDIGYKL